MEMITLPASVFAAFGPASSLRPGARRGLVISCASRKERVQKRSKSLKSTKSIVDLCHDIREFNLEFGLPEDCVPSTKELTLHGRKDLANRVRRRGYKSIAEHLLNQDKCEIDAVGCPVSVPEPIEAAISEENLLRGTSDSLNPDSDSCDSTMEKDTRETPAGTMEKERYNGSLEGPLNSLSLQEKAANFVYNGELDALEGGLEMPETHILDLDHEALEAFGDSHSKMVDEALTNFVGINGKVNSTLKGEHASALSYSSLSRYNSMLYKEQIATEVRHPAFEERNQANQEEIQRLKEMLDQKESELSQLKKEIEKEKLALSILEAKSKYELENAQKNILEKDLELHEAEESLAGLKEVKIEYRGSGDTVEVAGSFNGWHHKIEMNPSFETGGSSRSRKLMVWSTVLWLYPGVYEIKYIVDGHWKVDSTKEIRHMGPIENNIIRVDS